MEKQEVIDKLRKRTRPVLENNHAELAPKNSAKEWRYGDFAYKMREK